MCLTLINEELHTASRDILVYKIISNDNSSYHREFPYEPNTLYRLRKALKPVWGEVFRGFHAYISYIGYDGNRHFIPNRAKIVAFIVPKGAKYYLGHHGEIVSTSIRSWDLKHLTHDRRYDVLKLYKELPL